MAEHQTKPGWVVKKEVSIPDVIAFLTSMAFVIMAYATLDKRLALLEASKIEQQLTDARQDRDSMRLTSEVKEQLQRMNDKLDRLVERERPRP
jgi:hypothetical protein